MKKDPKDFQIPMILLSIGLLSALIRVFLIAGAAGGAIIFVIAMFGLVIRVAVGIAGCFVAAYVLGTNYGTIPSASLKLAAISVFPGELAFGGIALAALAFNSLLLVIVIGLLAIAFAFWLTGYLFELDMFEVFWTVFILTVVSAVVANLVESAKAHFLSQ
jgi:hypothetical protein